MHRLFALFTIIASKTNRPSKKAQGAGGTAGDSLDEHPAGSSWRGGPPAYDVR